MNVYFVNCLLASLLAYVIGYIVAKRTMERQFRAVMRSLIERGMVKTSVTSDVSIH